MSAAGPPVTTPGHRARLVGACLVVLAMVSCIVPTIAIPIAHAKMLGLFGPDLGAAVAFSLVGAFLLARGAVRNLAVIMCVQGVGASVTSLTIVVFNLAELSGPLHGVGLWAAWLNGFIWVPGPTLLTPLILLFPTGRFAARGWRWVAGAALAFGAAFVIPELITRQSVLEGKPESFAPNPTALIDSGWTDVAVAASFPGLLACLAISLGSLAARRRRAVGVERAQLTTLLFGVAVSVIMLAYIATQPNALETSPLIFAIELFAIMPIAVSFAVAVSRYRLYEIDKIVSRTVSYALVLAMLAGTYIGVTAGLANLVPDRYGHVGVAVATLVVSVLAVPLTRRVRRVVDHRFNRSRFDAERVAAAFAARLRARPEQGDIPSDLLDVVQRTVAPAHAGVWLVARPETSQ